MSDKLQVFIDGKPVDCTVGPLILPEPGHGLSTTGTDRTLECAGLWAAPTNDDVMAAIKAQIESSEFMPISVIIPFKVIRTPRKLKKKMKKLGFVSGFKSYNLIIGNAKLERHG
jgi:hypothetical protein